GRDAGIGHGIRRGQAPDAGRLRARDLREEPEDRRRQPRRLRRRIPIVCQRDRREPGLPLVAGHKRSLMTKRKRASLLIAAAAALAVSCSKIGPITAPGLSSGRADFTLAPTLGPAITPA